MKKVINGLILLVCSSCVFAQGAKLKGENRINISYTPQLYLNGAGDVDHYGDNYNQQVIYPKNTFGQNFGIEYQRTTRYGLIMSVGLQTGMEKHDFSEHYNLGYVDAGAPELKNTWIDTQYKATVKQMAIRFMVGYRWASLFSKSSDWDAEVKAGIALRRYEYGVANTHNRLMLTYEKNDTIFIKDVAANYGGYGSGQKFPSGFHSSFEFYFGLTKHVDVSFISTLSIGLELTRGLSNQLSSGGMHVTLYSTDNYTGNELSESRNEYSSPDFALGIKFAVGLWPNIKSRK